MRFLWDKWVDYLREGMDTALTMPTSTLSNKMASEGGHVYGTGPAQNNKIRTHYIDNYNLVYNWFFKWPEDAEKKLAASNNNLNAARYGLKAVNLPANVTRLKKTEDVDASDYELSTTGAKFDIRDLTALRARYHSEQTRDWLAADRYQEIMNEIFGVKVGENPEERPWLIDHHNTWLRGTNVYATDGSSLGDRAGVMAIDFNHNIQFPAPEHGLIAWFLVLRIPPYYDKGYNPMAGQKVTDWAQITGEPRLIKAQKPEAVPTNKYLAVGTGATIGYEPAGQHLRQGWTSVDPILVERGTMPIMTTGAEFNYHNPVDHIFTSDALGNFWGNMHFEQIVGSRVPEPMYSVMTGD